ncbi:hypothetical protein LOZ65_004579 [Ophidiomyces ophidiicola]|nr:hypothetical protein LOZ65_004579 [Ophidiomyces ophidiicola]
MRKIGVIPDRPWSRMLWAWLLLWNGRWAGTRWQYDRRSSLTVKKQDTISKMGINGKHTEKVDERTSRRNFIVFRLLLAVTAYLILDLLGWVSLPPEDIQIIYSVEKQYIFRRRSQITLEEIGFRVGAVLGYGVAATAMLTKLHSVSAALMVGIGASEPEEWPYIFGNVFDAWSLRQFWSTTWHQQLGRSLVAHSDYITYNVLRVPKTNRILVRYLRVVLVFTISGLLHVLTDSALDIPFQESGAVDFFLTQTLGIALEDMVFAINRSQNESPPPWQRPIYLTLGYLWTASFIVWSAPVWIYPSMRHSSPGMIKPVPFSLLTVLFGPKSAL